MRNSCNSTIPLEANPGASLGATIGALTLIGQNKLTLVTSPSVRNFGLWIEQLIAESTGKSGKGIIPVAQEPLSVASNYDCDRIFTYIRLDTDDNQDTDKWIGEMKQKGHTLIQLNLSNAYDIGAEFFRWEFATAVAGAVIGVHPFDQPNVQQAKDMTGKVIRQYQSTGSLPQINSLESLDNLIMDWHEGDYLAIMAYIQESPAVGKAFADLRRRVLERHRIATTIGYGPRFLHSTGQLHKGGGGNGVFIQLTTSHHKDLDIPGECYTFGTLANAQAIGDLQALQNLGRKVFHLHIDSANSREINKLADALVQAHPKIHGQTTL